MELQINAKQNNSYKVMTAENFELLPLSLEELFPEAKQVLILTDSNVEKLHKKDLVDYLDKKYNVLFYSVKAGEASKNIDYVFYRKLKLSRIQLRKLSNEGQVPGMKKSSW